MPFAVSGAARLAYDATGDGPPVLLLHAGVTDRRSWGPLVEALGSGYRTIAYDRRGFGETAYEPEPHTEVGDALAVLDAEGVHDAIVIGASNGGRRAIDLVLTHPERVRGLVLIGAAVRGAPEEDPTTFDEPVQALYAAYEAAEEGDDLDELNRVEAHAWLDGWAAEEGRVSGAVRNLFLDMNGIAVRSPDPGPDEDLPSAWDRLDAIRVPTLVLCGELDVMSSYLSHHLAAEIPGARYEELHGTGHLPHLEGHPRTLEVITGFVAGVA
jgi:pimeloyl-ACP methyl ester carboxylesterase